jgi:hypothetical protein
MRNGLSPLSSFGNSVSGRTIWGHPQAAPGAAPLWTCCSHTASAKPVGDRHKRVPRPSGRAAVIRLRQSRSEIGITTGYRRSAAPTLANLVGRPSSFLPVRPAPVAPTPLSTCLPSRATPSRGPLCRRRSPSVSAAIDRIPEGFRPQPLPPRRRASAGYCSAPPVAPLAACAGIRLLSPFERTCCELVSEKEAVQNCDRLAPP